MDARADLKVFAGCAHRYLRKCFLPNNCIAATAITIDVMTHYGYQAEPWEVCLRVDAEPVHLDVGCFAPDSEENVGGHLVAIVDRAFLVDASFAQVRSACPGLASPAVFVGDLSGSSVFVTPWARVNYVSRSISRDWRRLPDWGASPERESVVRAIIETMDASRPTK